MTGECFMKICMDRKPENCSHCIYREELSRYFDLEDYCVKNGKRTGKINIQKDCPLRESRIRRCARKIFSTLQDRKKTEHRTEDIIQMKTDITLTDKDGKLIEVKTPEPEYWSDSMW